MTIHKAYNGREFDAFTPGDFDKVFHYACFRKILASAYTAHFEQTLRFRLC